MKTLQQHIFLFTILFFMAVTANAGQVTSTFTAGDTLTAAKMTEIKDAANDNDSRVGAIETQTQNLATGCIAGQSIRAIAIDGTVTCEVDSNAGGDITAVNTGATSGLNGGVTAGVADLSVDPTDFNAIPSTSNSGLLALTSATYVTIDSQTINIPTAGYVVAMASSSLFCSTCDITNNSISYLFTICHTDTACGSDVDAQQGRIYFNASATDSSGFENALMTVHRTYFFSTSGVKTFFYRAKRTGGTATANVLKNRITLFFIPQ